MAMDSTTAMGIYHYWNPLYPVVGLAAAVVGTAAAIVTLPFQVLGAAAAQAPYYAPPQQKLLRPSKAMERLDTRHRKRITRRPRFPTAPPAPSYYYAPARALLCTAVGRATAVTAAIDGYAANAGYYRPNGGPTRWYRNGGPNGGNYAPRPTPYGPPNGYYNPRPNEYNTNTR